MGWGAVGDGVWVGWGAVSGGVGGGGVGVWAGVGGYGHDGVGLGPVDGYKRLSRNFLIFRDKIVFFSFLNGRLREITVKQIERVI